MKIEAHSDHPVNAADGLTESISANQRVDRDFMYRWLLLGDSLVSRLVKQAQVD